MKVTVVGTGYVGLSLAVLFSRKYEVIALDISQERVDLINKRISPIKDNDISEYFKNKKLELKATMDKEIAYSNSNFIIIATPTNYNEKNKSFDTSTIEQVLDDIMKINDTASIVIKSTVPIGYTESLKEKYKRDNIFFSPEFLRENNALHDNLHPSRIIVGSRSAEGLAFADLLLKCAKKDQHKIRVLQMSSKEAEAVKLFANSFLAMRISFFNELDTFAQINKISSEEIINGVCADDRIGNFYNNPSFGYGGYCLPKDTRQLLDAFFNVPSSLISAIVESNNIRKDFIAKLVISKKPKSIGIYKLSMKKDSDNYRESAVLDIIKKLDDIKVKMYIYEPQLKMSHYEGIEVLQDFQDFISKSELVIANRLSSELEKVHSNVLTRDLFMEN